MENFLTKFTPVSSITIFTALFKRVETGEWTNEREKEVENFVEIFDRSLNEIRRKNDKERAEKFESFGIGDILRFRISY